MFGFGFDCQQTRFFLMFTNCVECFVYGVTLFGWLNGFSVRKQIMEFGTATNVCLYAPGWLLLMYLGLYIYLVFFFLVENAPISSGPIWKEIEEKNWIACLNKLVANKRVGFLMFRIQARVFVRATFNCFLQIWPLRTRINNAFMLATTLHNKGCVTLWPCHFTLKRMILRQKKNYGNSNISACPKYNLRKIL